MDFSLFFGNFGKRVVLFFFSFFLFLLFTVESTARRCVGTFRFHRVDQVGAGFTGWEWGLLGFTGFFWVGLD